jgi:hypothetical protein
MMRLLRPARSGICSLGAVLATAIISQTGSQAPDSNFSLVHSNHA